MSKSLNSIILSLLLLFVNSSLYSQINLGGAFTVKNASVLSMASVSSNSGDLTMAFRQTDDIIINQDTLLHNGTFSNGTFRIMNVSPQGLLNWTISSQKNFNGYISELKSSNSGDIYALGGFLGSIQIGNNLIVHTDTTETSFSGLEYFILKINYRGEVIFFRKLPNTLNDDPIDFNISSKSELILSISFDSVFNMDAFTISELPVSLANNSGASAIVVIDPMGAVSKIINTDCDGVDGSPEFAINPLNGNIISLTGFGQAPPFEPNIQPFAFSLLEFDSLGNYLRFRPIQIDFNASIEFNFMENEDFVLKEFNDSAEFVYPCPNIQPGSDKVGYFNYETGPFSFPSKCQVYGAPSLDYNSVSIFSDELIGERQITPGGFYKDNAVYDSSDFIMMAFNPDSSKLAWLKGFNIPINQMAFDEGHQIVGISLTDSVTTIDSLTFTHELGTTESLFLSYYNCMYFKPNTEISQINDTVRLLASDLEADWYLNGNLVAVNSESYIVPNQSGIYHAIMRNEFGCTVLSDSSTFSVALNDEIPDQIKVFPNPASDHIIFESVDFYNAEIKVYDLRGFMIEDKKLLEDELRLNISTYPRGLYIYNIQTKSGKISGKFVKE